MRAQTSFENLAVARGATAWTRWHPHARRAARLFALAATCVLAACGGGGDGSSTGGGSTGDDFSGVPSCAMSAFEVRGTVDGMPFTWSLTDVGGFVSQVMTPAELLVTTPSSMPPETTLAEIEWNNLIADGAAVDVSGGYLLSPQGEPLAGMKICPGAGSRVMITADGNTVEFVLHGLTTGTDCPGSTPVTGELLGCRR
jgi:hypothetical protein